jgi:copper chaperone CopZ
MLGVAGVTAAHVDLSGKRATFDGSASVADVKAAIVKAGYRTV